MFNSKSIWARNKKEKDAIVYILNGKATRVTVEMFIDDGLSEETFLRFKAESDAMFNEEDILDSLENRHSEPIDEAEKFGKCSAKSPEDLIVERIDRQTHREYLETLQPLAKKALDKLTVVQRRRYLLHVCEGLTTRRIAEIEGVKHPSIVESLQAADKKIKKIIADAKKTPYQK